MKLYEKRGEIREGIWLWYLLCLYTKSSPEKWWLVGDGEPFSDEVLAAVINVPASTVASWRKRLVAAGAIRVRKVDRRRWSYEVLNLQFELGQYKQALDDFALPAGSRVN